MRNLVQAELLLRVRRACAARALARVDEPTFLPRVRAPSQARAFEGGRPSRVRALRAGLSARAAVEAGGPAARRRARRRGARAPSGGGGRASTAARLRPRRDCARTADRPLGAGLRLRRADEEGDALPTPRASPRALLAAPRQA